MMVHKNEEKISAKYQHTNTHTHTHAHTNAQFVSVTGVLKQLSTGSGWPLNKPYCSADNQFIFRACLYASDDHTSCFI